MPIPVTFHIPKPVLFYSSQLCTVGLHQTFGYNTGLKNCVWLMASQEDPGLLFSFTAFESPWFHIQAAFSFLMHDFRLSQCKIPVFYPEEPSSPFPLTYRHSDQSLHPFTLFKHHRGISCLAISSNFFRTQRSFENSAQQMQMLLN